MTFTEEVKRIKSDDFLTKEEYEFLVNTILNKIVENTFLINSNLYIDKDSDVNLEELMKNNDTLNSIIFKLDNLESSLIEVEND